MGKARVEGEGRSIELWRTDWEEESEGDGETNKESKIGQREGVREEWGHCKRSTEESRLGNKEAARFREAPFSGGVKKASSARTGYFLTKPGHRSLDTIAPQPEKKIVRRGIAAKVFVLEKLNGG